MHQAKLATHQLTPSNLLPLQSGHAAEEQIARVINELYQVTNQTYRLRRELYHLAETPPPTPPSRSSMRSPTGPTSPTTPSPSSSSSPTSSSSAVSSSASSSSAASPTSSAAPSPTPSPPRRPYHLRRHLRYRRHHLIQTPLRSTSNWSRMWSSPHVDPASASPSRTRTRYPLCRIPIRTRIRTYLMHPRRNNNIRTGARRRPIRTPRIGAVSDPWRRGFSFRFHMGTASSRPDNAPWTLWLRVIGWVASNVDFIPPTYPRRRPRRLPRGRPKRYKKRAQEP
ncbi:hypothetical protein M8J75_003922 [Diaphorina citri]|nr:hypothetical protein M8J75_003922 [Diaphorina citri]